jgi:hypothetical protein
MLVWQPSRVEADFAPDWLRAAAQDSLPKYPEDTVAVTLLSEHLGAVDTPRRLV